MSWNSIRLILMVLCGSAGGPTFVDSRKLHYNRYGPGVHEIFTYFPGAAGVGIVNAIVTDLTAVENSGNGLITGMEINSLTSGTEASIAAITDLVVTVPTNGTTVPSTDNEMGTVSIDGLTGTVTTRKPLVDFGSSGFETVPPGGESETGSFGTTSVGSSELAPLGSLSGTEMEIGGTVPTVGTDSIDTSAGTPMTSKPLTTFGMPDTGTSASSIAGGETGGTTTGGSSVLESIVSGSTSSTEIGTGGSNLTSETGLIDTEVGTITTRKPLVGVPNIETSGSEGPELGSAGIAPGGSEGLHSIDGPAETATTRKPLGASASEPTGTEVDFSESSIDGSEQSPSIELGSLSAMETDFIIPTLANGSVDSTTETVTTRRPLEPSGTLGVETSLFGSTGAETGSSGSTTNGLSELASIDHGLIAGPEMGTMETNSIDTEGGNVTTRKPLVPSGFPGTESGTSEIGPTSVSSEPPTNSLVELSSIVLGSISGPDPAMWTTRRPLLPLHSTTLDPGVQTEYNQPTEANYPAPLEKPNFAVPQLPPSWSIPGVTSDASKPNIPLGSLLELAGQYSPQNTTTTRTPSQVSSSSTIFTNTNINQMQSLLSSLQSVHSTLEAVNQQLESDINSANLLSVETQPDISEGCHEEDYQGAQQSHAGSFPEPPYNNDNDYYRITRRIHKGTRNLKIWPLMRG